MQEKERKIEWTPDGVDSLNEIIEYYIDIAGENNATNIYKKIINKIETVKNSKIKTRQSQILKDIGIFDVFELVINHWIIYYKVSADNRKAYILFVLDGRRNLEEILISKVIDQKI